MPMRSIATKRVKNVEGQALKVRINRKRAFLCSLRRTFAAIREKKKGAPEGAPFFCRTIFVARFYRPEVEAFCAAGAELALGTLTYPLMVSLDTLLITISSGIFVPEV